MLLGTLLYPVNLKNMDTQKEYSTIFFEVGKATCCLGGIICGHWHKG